MDEDEEIIEAIISIHAPVKGATLYQVQSVGLEEYFNPRSREGSDLGRNVDGYAVALISIHAPVKGATMAIIDVMSQFTISIHAPVKGATISS